MRMHPYLHAEATPDRPAFVSFESGRIVTYAELDADSNRAAQLWRGLGLAPGDVVAVLLKNGPVYPVVYWGAQRSGVMTTPISTHLKRDEVAYILRDCGAKALVTSVDASAAAAELIARRADLAPDLRAVFTVGRGAEGALDWRGSLDDMPATRVEGEVSGYYLVYSSGSTGRPKGIMLPFAPGPIDEPAGVELASLRSREGEPPPQTILIPAPLYHAAPLMSFICAHRRGDTAVVLERFDAERMLEAIQTWRVGSIQVVPTMFVRLLALPEATRRAYDLSSLKKVTHAAAPCPVAVKRRMMEWLGPIIHEYYSGSEAIGRCAITPEEWLKKPGSVGRANWGTLHICGEDGEEVAAGERGLIYFEGDSTFTYRNDPAKTAASRHPRHPTWATLGDIGHVDEDGYLFLSDRKDFMIISGGVNIYPQATEDLLIGHPKVFDAAVIGAPNEEFGEEVKAVVQPRDWEEAGPALEAELIAHCQAHVSHVAAPRSVDFVRELPRLPTGKLAKHEIRKPYWPEGRFIGGDTGKPA
jgi:acyl-CoA synthetase (AMP-forming)/AMP-acid ligase II